MQTKVCGVCNEEKDVEKFGNSWDESRKRNVCRACLGKRERAKLKLDMLNAFGRRCQCCGETIPLFLSLDHIKNDGYMYRDQYNEQQIYRLARREGWPKDKYQCLCMNCNFAKGHFGFCPHERGLTAQQLFAELEVKASGTGRSLVDYQNQYTKSSGTPEEQLLKALSELPLAQALALLGSEGERKK